LPDHRATGGDRVGSQAIHGSFREDELTAAATMSVEVDILPIANSNDKTARLADLIEGVAGEFSTFEELHGVLRGASNEVGILTCAVAVAGSTCGTPQSEVHR
jgi:hypothetical protein